MQNASESEGSAVQGLLADWLNGGRLCSTNTTSNSIERHEEENEALSI